MQLGSSPAPEKAGRIGLVKQRAMELYKRADSQGHWPANVAGLHAC